jgi:hypothetical protein
MTSLRVACPVDLDAHLRHMEHRRQDEEVEKRLMASLWARLQGGCRSSSGGAMRHVVLLGALVVLAAVLTVPASAHELSG